MNFGRDFLSQQAEYLNQGNTNVNFKKETTLPNGNEAVITATKKPQENVLNVQETAKPMKKILLFGENKARFLFPIMKDKEIGIQPKYQNVIIESHNDDDRRTSSTQLQRGMYQTLQDLYDVISRDSSSYYTQK